ncbi:MAG: acetolactate synthase [Clostridia bacterium]|nr:acetolactate synthase [Clostridia bacterium]
MKQLSIFVENKFGRAYSIIDTLSANNINISALSIADTSEYGIMRLIVDDCEKAKAILKENGIMVKITDVLAIPMGNTPGELSKLLKIFTDSMISVEYMYAFVSKKNDGAVLVTKTNDTENSISALKKMGISPLNHEDLF